MYHFQYDKKTISIVKIHGVDIITSFGISLIKNEQIIDMISWNNALYIATYLDIYILNDNGIATPIHTNVGINTQIVNMIVHKNYLYVECYNFKNGKRKIFKIAPDNTIMSVIPLIGKHNIHIDKLRSDGDNLYHYNMENLTKIVDDVVIDSIIGLKNNLVINNDVIFYVDETKHNIMRYVTPECSELVATFPDAQILDMIFHKKTLYSLRCISVRLATCMTDQYILTNHATNDDIEVKPSYNMISFGEHIYMYGGDILLMSITQIPVTAATYWQQTPKMRAQMLTTALVVAQYSGNRDIAGEIFRYF